MRRYGRTKKVYTKIDIFRQNIYLTFDHDLWPWHIYIHCEGTDLRYMQSKYEVDRISHWEDMGWPKSVYQMLTDTQTQQTHRLTHRLTHRETGRQRDRDRKSYWRVSSWDVGNAVLHISRSSADTAKLRNTTLEIFSYFINWTSLLKCAFVGFYCILGGVKGNQTRMKSVCIAKIFLHHGSLIH